MFDFVLVLQTRPTSNNLQEIIAFPTALWAVHWVKNLHEGAQLKYLIFLRLTRQLPVQYLDLVTTEITSS